jgi:hypothetical protein
MQRRVSMTEWIGLLAGPLAWSVDALVIYALAPWSCEHVRLPLHIAALVCLAGAIAGGVIAWRNWREVWGWPSPMDEPSLGRDRFLAVVGVMSAALFAAVIIAQWIAVMMLDPCAPGASL